MKNSFRAAQRILPLIAALTVFPSRNSDATEASFGAWSVRYYSSFAKQPLAGATALSPDGAELFVGCRFSHGRLSAFLGLPERDRTLSDRGVSKLAFRMDDDLIHVDGFSSSNGEQYYEVTFLPPEVLAKLLSLTKTSFGVTLQDSHMNTLSSMDFDVRGAGNAIAEVRAVCGIGASPPQK
jgi:hypothetical protein